MPLNFQVVIAEDFPVPRSCPGKLVVSPFEDKSSQFPVRSWGAGSLIPAPACRRTSSAMPAVAVSNEYLGNSLDSVWRLFNQRSAFVGTFSRESGKATAQLTESAR